MIGSGWLFGAYYAAQIAGPASLVSWLLGGVLVIFIALTFSELSTMLPVSGGLARFTQFSHGTLVSFCMSWLAWLSCVAVAPTEVQAILQYATHYIPWLTHSVNDTALLTPPGLLVASVLLLFISFMNILGIKTLLRYNLWITVWKVLIPIIVLIILIANFFEPHNLIQHGGFAPTGLHGILWALPTAGIIFSFLGFREATSLAGEAKRPQIAIPLAVIGSVVLCTALYLCIQLAFLGALKPSMLIHGWQHLQFSHKAGPFAGIATALGLGGLTLLIYADSIISPLGASLVYTATTARLAYAMSVNKYTPAALMKLNERGVPAVAVFVNFLVGLFMFIPLPGWQKLVGFQSLAIVLAYGTGPISLLALRQQTPNLTRPFKLPFVYILSGISFYVCNLLAYWSGWEMIWRLMVSLGLGIIIFLVYRYKHKPLIELNLKSAIWLLPNFGGLMLISYCGNFGGGVGLIPFGWDFAVIAVFSLIIMVIAHYSRLTPEATRAQLPKTFDWKLEGE